MATFLGLSSHTWHDLGGVEVIAIFLIDTLNQIKRQHVASHIAIIAFIKARTILCYREI